MKPEIIEAFYLSFKLALITTTLLLIISVPLGYWLSKPKQSIIKLICESIITLPLVLPSSVIGFYLLIMLSKNSQMGNLFYNLTGKNIIFDFNGLVIGSVIYSLPFVVRPIQSSFSGFPKSYLEASATLGASPLNRFFTILIPNCKNGIFTGLTLGFTHTLGEFGIILIIGGNIPGETQTISIAIFNAIESLNYKEAHFASSILVLISFLTIITLSIINKSSLLNIIKIKKENEKTLNKYHI